MKINMNDDNCQIKNGDGVSPVYQQREAINKKAIQNLERPTPGKLGKLNNLQVFNFELNPDIAAAVGDNYFVEYNTTNTFPANVTQALMFGVDGINGKALYYNVVDIKATLYTTLAISNNLLEDSYVEWYTLQNINGSTTSLGTKIPQPAPLYGNGGGAVTFTTTGNEQGNQYFKVNLTNDNVNTPSNSKGLRCSGLGLKAINLQFASAENLDGILMNFQVFVDTTSVSTSY